MWTSHSLLAQATDPLRPADLLDPAEEDILATDENVEPAVIPPKVPAEEPAQAVPRKRKPDAEPYAPQGIDAGGLRLFPVLQLGGIVSSNPGQAVSGEDAALGLRIAPSLRVESDWVRHSLRFDGSAELVDYPRSGIAAETSGRAALTGRIDIRRTTFADLEASYDIDSTGSSDSEVPDAATGDRIEHDVGLFAALTHEFGRLAMRWRTGARVSLIEDVELANGGREDNSDRNFLEPEASLRATYEMSPAFKPFAEIAYRPRFHFERPDRNGFDRNSHGFQLRAGVQFDSAPIWSGEFAIADTFRSYADPGLDTINAIGLIGNIVWRPTELTTVTATANTSLEETVTAGSSGTQVYEGRLDVEHLLRENIAIRTGAGVQLDARDGPNDWTFDATADVTYRFNPWLAWTATYDFTAFESGSPNSDYVEHRLSTGIEIRR